jgi:hypothetical protein
VSNESFVEKLRKIAQKKKKKHGNLICQRERET